MLKKLYQSAAFLSALFLLFACGATRENHRNRLILQGIDSLRINDFQIPETIIKKGDLLTILVFSDNPIATEIYNQPMVGGGAGANVGNATGISTMGRGYMVDKEGKIYFHSLGELSVVGKTRKDVADELKAGLAKYLQNPYVTVRFTNARITIVGEVLKPGVIELPDQRVSILDAIGFAGDMTPFGRRDNILIVREIEGKRHIGRIDLRDASMYSSPYYFLQQNDMVYIEPNRKKPTGNEQVLMRNITVATSLLSIVTLLVTLINR